MRNKELFRSAAYSVYNVNYRTFPSDIVWSGTKFVVMTRSPFTGIVSIFQSVNGINWMQSATNIGIGIPLTLEYANGKYFLFDNQPVEGKNWRSIDGLSWETINFGLPSVTAGFENAAWNGSNWLLTGHRETASTPSILSSTDLITFTKQNNVLRNNAIWDGSRWVSYYNDSTINRFIFSSSIDNGVTWTGIGTGILGMFGKKLASNGVNVVALCQLSNVIDIYTVQGTTRIQRTIPAPANTDTAFIDILWDGTRYVAISTITSRFRVLTSPDGNTWTIQYTSPLNSPTPSGIAYNGTLYVLPGISTSSMTASILTSPDLINWTQRL